MSVQEKELLFSVCIPVRNDLKNLKRCLTALAGQDLSSCEILVCDDGSSPPLSGAELQETGAPVTLIHQKGQGPAVARNHIAQLARGKYLFFMDADTVSSRDLIRKTAQVIAENPGIPVFYGSYDDDPDSRTLVSAYRNLLHHYTHHQSAKKMERVSTFWCGCGVILRELYLKSGGLSVGYGRPSIEDIELGTRLAAAGTPIRIFPQIQVKHLKKWTVKSWLYTDLFLRGIPWVRLMRSSKSWSNQLNFSWSQRIASLAAVGVVMSIPLAIWQPLFAVAGLGSLATFVTLNRHLLNLIRRKRGIAGAVAVIPLHLAYALVCVLSVAAALLYPPLKLPPTQELQPLLER
jgi:glycosyltransferase involved in cell wall biosynthesis